jgi:serine/threonine protein kinase
MSEELHPIRRAAIRERAIDALFDLPERIGRYEIRGELGRGGMGVVYDGFDGNLSRTIAVKLIDEKLLSETGLSDDELHERFEREMRATSRLFHPNLVAILDAGFATVRGHSRAYYVMERIEGESLETRLRRSGPMSRGEGLNLAAAVARGLAAVHTEGLVHRDLKPSNILIPIRGEAKLTDFGLCQWQLESVGARKGRGIQGSPHYLAPEQVTQGEVDFRADLFSLGAVLVHIFSGAPPFPASSLSAQLGRIVTGDPDGLAQVDRDVRGLACELLSKTPSDRPVSAEAVAQRLEELARNSRSHEPLRRVLRKVALATGVVAGAVALLGVWAEQDLAQMRAETQLRRQELEIQLDRARSLAPTLSSLSESDDRYGVGDRGELRDEVTGTLNRIAVERRRYEEAASKLSARLDALPWSLFAPLMESPDPAPPIGFELGSESSVYDPDAYLSVGELFDLEQQLRLLKEELEVEARVLFVTPPPHQPLESFGIESFDGMTADGFGSGGRGLLLLVDGKSRRARVEVGYRLEPYLTDALAGALARQHLAPSVAADEPGLELRIILRIVRQRLRSAILAGSFELPEMPELTSRYGAGGGGSSAVAQLDTSEPVSASHYERTTEYGPGATVREVFDRYRHWLRHGNFDATVGLFTPDSRALVEAWRGTRVYLEQMSKSPVIGPVEVVERDGWAILYPLSDPLAPPHFFRRDVQGWRIDLAARERHVIAIAGGSFTWTLSNINDLPLSKYHDKLEIVDGLIRIQGGDNRTLAAAQGSSLAVANAPRS